MHHRRRYLAWASLTWGKSNIINNKLIEKYEFVFWHDCLLYACSVTDLPEHILYDAWSMKQPNPELFTIFMKKFLTNAMEWATSKSLNVWNNGSIQNILRYSDGIQSKNEFCVRLIYSFGFALTPEYQDDFAGKVSFSSAFFLPLSLFLFLSLSLYLPLRLWLSFKFALISRCLNGAIITPEVERSQSTAISTKHVMQLSCTRPMSL